MFVLLPLNIFFSVVSSVIWCGGRLLHLLTFTAATDGKSRAIIGLNLLEFMDDEALQCVLQSAKEFFTFTPDEEEFERNNLNKKFDDEVF